MEWNHIIKKVQSDGFCVIENFLESKNLELMQETTKNDQTNALILICIRQSTFVYKPVTLS